MLLLLHFVLLATMSLAVQGACQCRNTPSGLVMKCAATNKLYKSCLNKLSEVVHIDLQNYKGPCIDFSTSRYPQLKSVTVYGPTLQACSCDAKGKTVNGCNTFITGQGQLEMLSQPQVNTTEGSGEYPDNI
jgi:hypothetical protein